MIDRCVCTNMTFAALLDAARREGLGFDQLVAATGCGKRCGLCVPYVRAALSQGRTAFAVGEKPATAPQTSMSDR